MLSACCWGRANNSID